MLGDGRARIVRLVHAVAETGDAAAFHLRLLHELLDAHAGVADCHELAQHRLVRAAMPWARERVDASGDGRIQIRVRGAGDAHHRRRAVLLMVGVDDEQTAERMHIQRIGFEAFVGHREAHANEVVDVAARIVRVEHRFVAAPAQNVADHRARLGHDDHGGLIELFRIADVGGVGVEGGERVDCGGHDAHRLRPAWERAHERTEILTYHRVVVDVFHESVVLGFCGQLTIAQQP